MHIQILLQIAISLLGGCVTCYHYEFVTVGRDTVFLEETEMTYTNVSSLVFLVKGTYDAVMYLGTRDRRYKYKVGIETNQGTFSVLTKLYYNETTLKQLTYSATDDVDILKNDTFEFLWIAWENDTIAVGSGDQVMENTFISDQDSDVQVGLEIIRIRSFQNSRIYWIFGDDLHNLVSSTTIVSPRNEFITAVTATTSAIYSTPNLEVTTIQDIVGSSTQYVTSSTLAQDVSNSEHVSSTITLVDLESTSQSQSHITYQPLILQSDYLTQETGSGFWLLSSFPSDNQSKMRKTRHLDADSSTLPVTSDWASFEQSVTTSSFVQHISSTESKVGLSSLLVTGYQLYSTQNEVNGQSEDKHKSQTTPLSSNSSTETNSYGSLGITSITPSLTSSTTQNEKSSCLCQKTSSYMLSEDHLASVRRSLLVNKTTLSSTIRKKNSAGDNRVSSKCLGSLAAIVIVGVCLSIVMVDLSNIPKNKVFLKP